jgi:hypothetical protein
MSILKTTDGCWAKELILLDACNRQSVMPTCTRGVAFEMYIFDGMLFA